METNESRDRGSRIKAIRKKLGLNQTQFGKLLDCEGREGKTKGTISGYETGTINPSLSVLAQIAEIGGSSFEEIATGRPPSKSGEIAATFQPGNTEATRRLLNNGKRASVKNFMLRKIVAWMDETFDGKEEQALMFYEDIVRRYPSFSKFVSPDLPPRIDQDQEKRDTAASA